MRRIAMTSSQRAMLLDLDRQIKRQREKHGDADAWIETGELVMDRAYDQRAGGLSWLNADRTLGALIRRGWLESNDKYGDLVRLSASGMAALAAEEPCRD